MLFRETVSPSTLDLLVRLSADPALQHFALAGDTSLALRFGHRLSIDLDFFTFTRFSNDELTFHLKQTYNFEIRRSLATGVTGFIEAVKVDFVKYAYPVLEFPQIMEGIRLMSLTDVIAMKLSAITNRGAKKDFFDLDMLIGERGLPYLLECYQQKYPNTDPMMLLRSLAYFGDAEEQEDPEALNGATWESVHARIHEAVRTFL